MEDGPSGPLGVAAVSAVVWAYRDVTVAAPIRTQDQMETPVLGTLMIIGRALTGLVMVCKLDNEPTS